MKENNLKKKNTYGPNDLSLFGLNVVDLWQLVVLVNMVVGMGVMTAGGDGVVAVVGVCERASAIVVDGKGLHIRAEFERMMKMKSENESENDHFCKSEGRVRFFKNDHFSVHF